MSDEQSTPITDCYFVYNKDEFKNAFRIDVTYDRPEDKAAALRIFEQHMKDNNLELWTGPIAHKKLVEREEEAKERKRLSEAREAAVEARHAALRKMGEDYELYDFSDFGLGNDLERLLDDDSGNDPDQKKQEARIAAVCACIKECFDNMRTEGEWRYHYQNWDNLGGGRFVWEPKLWSDFWCDDFPFVLDLRPEDILPALQGNIGDMENWDTGELTWDEETAEAFDGMEATLERWMKAFTDAIVAVRTKAEELKAKQP
jgi:hypothetical protein